MLTGIWGNIDLNSSSATEGIKAVYTDGSLCHNSFGRKTDVYFKCGEVNVLDSIAEVAPCHYKMHFLSPNVCALIQNLFPIPPSFPTECISSSTLQSNNVEAPIMPTDDPLIRMEALELSLKNCVSNLDQCLSEKALMPS